MNRTEQNRWAGTLLAVRNLHFPDLKGFIDTLIGLIKDIPAHDEVFMLYDGAELQKYRNNFNLGVQRGKINPSIFISINNANLNAYNLWKTRNNLANT